MRGLAAGMNSIELFPRAAVCSWCVHAYSTHSWRRRHLASTAATHGLTNKTRARPRSRVGDDRRTGVERVGNLVRPRRRTRVLLLPEDAGRRAKQHMRTAQPAATARSTTGTPPVRRHLHAPHGGISIAVSVGSHRDPRLQILRTLRAASRYVRAPLFDLSLCNRARKHV
jgi:hypothetical protein